MPKILICCFTMLHPKQLLFHSLLHPVFIQTKPPSTQLFNTPNSAGQRGGWILVLHPPGFHIARTTMKADSASKERGRAQIHPIKTVGLKCPHGREGVWRCCPESADCQFKPSVVRVDGRPHLKHETELNQVKGSWERYP